MQSYHIVTGTPANDSPSQSSGSDSEGEQKKCISWIAGMYYNGNLFYMNMFYIPPIQLKKEDNNNLAK